MVGKPAPLLFTGGHRIPQDGGDMLCRDGVQQRLIPPGQLVQVLGRRHVKLGSVRQLLAPALAAQEFLHKRRPIDADPRVADALEQERVLVTPSENGHLMAVALIQLE